MSERKCVTPGHVHASDVAAKLARMATCTYAEPLEWRSNEGRTDISHPWEMWIDDDPDSYSFQVRGSSYTLARVASIEEGQALAEALQAIIEANS